MNKPRKKKPAAPHIVLATEEAMIGALNRHVELQLDLATSDAAHQETIARLNTAHTEATQARRAELAQLESSLHLFCTTHRADLFGTERKSKDYANATIGFRLSPPAVATIVPKESQETIALRLDSVEWGEPYVAWKATVNKEALLRDRLKLTPAQLGTAGIKFVQEESFFIDPNAEAAARITKPAQTEAA